MSLMSGLYTGVSGLHVNQRGITVAGHNIANVETEGYVRQQMGTTDSFYIQIGNKSTGLLQTGFGAKISAVTQFRDRFLDATFREESGRKGFYSSQYDATVEIEDIFGETEGVAFQDSMKDLWVSLQELCKEPSSIVTRSSLIQTAESFIKRAESIYKQIGDYQISLNTQVQTYVDRINTIAKDIYNLNHQIQKVEAAGFESANDLRDQRNLLVDELSEIIDVSYKEDSKGIMDIYVENYSLVTEDLVYEMKTRNVSEDSSMIEPYWPCYDSTSVFKFDRLPTADGDNDIGALKGLLLARGNKVGRYTDIPVEPKKEDYFDDVGGFDEDRYQIDYGKYKRDVENYELEIESSVCLNIQVQFDNLVHGVTTTINDILCPNKEVLLTTGERIKIFDEENAPVGMDPNSTAGEALFSRKSAERYKEEYITIVNESGTTETLKAWVYTEEDPENNYSLFTLGEIEVNPRILKNPSLIPISDKGQTGDYKVELCDQLLSAWQEAFDTISPTDLTKQNFNSYYTEMIGSLGTKGQRYKNIAESQEELVNSVDNQRQAIMAVSSDEDLTNIIKYQQGYNAASRYITAVDKMLEHLLNALG